MLELVQGRVLIVALVPVPGEPDFAWLAFGLLKLVLKMPAEPRLQNLLAEFDWNWMPAYSWKKILKPYSHWKMVHRLRELS